MHLSWGLIRCTARPPKKNRYHLLSRISLAHGVLQLSRHPWIIIEYFFEGQQSARASSKLSSCDVEVNTSVLLKIWRTKKQMPFKYQNSNPKQNRAITNKNHHNWNIECENGNKNNWIGSIWKYQLWIKCSLIINSLRPVNCMILFNVSKLKI